MAAIPSLSRPYWTRGNVPFGTNNTSQLVTEAFSMWSFVHVCTDQLVTGTASTLTPRHANSIAIVRGSADGFGAGGAVTSPGVAGTNRWYNGGVFPGLVRGGNGSNHSWIMLEWTALGYEMVVNFSQNDGYVAIAFAKVGTFSGGSATNTPTPSDSTKVICLRNVTYSAFDVGQSNIFGDTTSNNLTRYMTITFADTGEFFCMFQRAGLGAFTTAFGFWKSVGQHVSDTENAFLLSCSSDASARGAMKYNQINTTQFCSSRQPGGSIKTAGGVIVSYAGAELVMNVGGDALTGLYDVDPMVIKDLSPQVVRRGTLPDLYMCGTEAVGAAIPAAGATQTMTVVGDIIVPCIQVQPIT